jgi:hypothetical protein
VVVTAKCMKNKGWAEKRIGGREGIRTLRPPHCENEKGYFSNSLICARFPFPLLISRSLSGYDDSVYLIVPVSKIFSTILEQSRIVWLRHSRHYTRTSISQVVTVKGIPFSALTSKHSFIASWMFSQPHAL